jgi:preprotein translocase subunit SecF
MFDIVGKRLWYFFISGVIILAGIISLIVFGLEPGIEFSSGSLLTIDFEPSVTTPQLKQALGELGYSNAVIQTTGEGHFLVRLPELTSANREILETGLSHKVGTLEVKGFDSVSPMIAQETTRNAAIAVSIAAVGMLLYISWAFHRMPNPFRWGVCAIVSLVHGLLIVLGLFAIFGATLGWQIDLMFVTGILTLVGYSVNDTIVVFDRIRENLFKSGGVDFETVVNNSLLETLARSLITGIGVIFVLITLLLVIGASIQNLIVVLLVGIPVGTYGSICIAAPLLIVWRKGEWSRFIGRRPAVAVKGK